LRGVNLEGANLRDVNLKGANLRDVNLEGANLEGADLYQIVGCGSVGRCTTYDIKNDKIICGCFYGTLKDFSAKVDLDYPKEELKGQKGYSAAILFFEGIKKMYNA